MQKQIARWLALLLFLACTPGVFAQGTSQSVDSKEQAASKDQEKNIDEYIELLRTGVRQDKAQIMGAMMQLSTEQAAKFWPIYYEYDKALNKLNDLRLANIKDYARNYDQLSDEKADELIRNAINYQQQRLELLAKYYSNVKTALGAPEAGRFVQVENQLLMIIDLRIASSLPVVPKQTEASTRR